MPSEYNQYIKRDKVFDKTDFEKWLKNYNPLKLEEDDN